MRSIPVSTDFGLWLRGFVICAKWAPATAPPLLAFGMSTRYLTIWSREGTVCSPNACICCWFTVLSGSAIRAAVCGTLSEARVAGEPGCYMCIMGHILLWRAAPCCRN
jgi:hypothetical protein